jgi:hypothetical protein
VWAGPPNSGKLAGIAAFTPLMVLTVFTLFTAFTLVPTGSE